MSYWKSIILFLIICAGPYISDAQTRAPVTDEGGGLNSLFLEPFTIEFPSPPFLVAVTDVSSSSVSVWTNQATVSFLFTASELVNVDELDQELTKSGVQSKRLVRFIDGSRTVAEGKLHGRASASHRDGSLRATGFILKFDSVASANSAAAAIREKATLVSRKIADDNDRTGWIY